MKTIIREAKEINSLINAFAKKNPNINPKDLEQLFTADPTTVQNSRGVFAGKYCVWIGNQYVNGKLKVGDIPELKKALNTYNINKSQIMTPINEIGSLSDLITIISDYTDDFKATRQLSKGEQALEKVYEDADWVVYIPHTYEASRKIGGDTNWCTASSDDRYFNMYTKEGPLYVNIRKSDGAKFQFHFPTSQFMNAKDESIILKKIGLSKGLIEFYEKISPIFRLYYPFDYVGEYSDGYNAVMLNGKWNFLDEEGNFLFTKWVKADYIDAFWNNFAQVSLNGKWNFIDTKGKLISPNHWFDLTSNFSNGYASVKLNGKWNFLDEEGNFLFTKWVKADYIYAFWNNFAQVSLNGKWNFIDTKGKLISPNHWFDLTSNFSNGYASVKLNGKWNFLDEEGNFLFTKWVKADYIYAFWNNFAQVSLNGKWNFIDTQGKLVSPNQWFDWIGDFHDGYARVILNGKRNLIDTQGKLVSPNQWFDDAGDFSDGYASVKLNGKWYRIDTKGNITATVNEHTVTITKSDIKNMVMECVDKVIKEIYKN